MVYVIVRISSQLTLQKSVFSPPLLPDVAFLPTPPRLSVARVTSAARGSLSLAEGYCALVTGPPLLLLPSDAWSRRAGAPRDRHRFAIRSVTNGTRDERLSI